MTVGIICEYNPLHLGHQKQIHKIREVFGPETTIVCAMSEAKQSSMYEDALYTGTISDIWGIA